MSPGAKKVWGSRSGFLCCHCTLLQANVCLYQGLYGIDEGYFVYSPIPGFRAEGNLKDVQVVLNAKREALDRMHHLPDVKKMKLEFDVKEKADFSLPFAFPAGRTVRAGLKINGESTVYEQKKGYAVIQREWEGSFVITITMPMKVGVEYLDDRQEKEHSASARWCLQALRFRSNPLPVRKQKKRDSF